MSLDFTSLAYWGVRRESLDECTERLYGYMHAMAEIGPHLATWYETAASRSAALQKRISLDRQCLQHLLDDGRSWTDTDGRLMEALGFSIALWNGESNEHAVGLSISCGMYSEFVPWNNVVLERIKDDWPKDWLNVSTAVALVHATVLAWSPDWAGICSRQATDRASDEGTYQVDRPFVDWIVFHRLKRRRALPPPARVAFETIDGGECIVVQDTPVRIDNPDECAHARAVAHALGL